MEERIDKKSSLMEKIVSLCKRRGFIFPGSEIYGGLANSWDYGPLGVELKNNIKQLWWKKFVQERDDMVGIDAALIMNPKVWEASGHLKNFSDALIECKNCHHRFRTDSLTIDGGRYVCTDCNGRDFTEAKSFNLMFKTFLGLSEDAANIVYFRPETAQGMFVDFKNVLNTSRKQIPFGIAQMGKAFRNEITPGNFIFRTREFEQMEIEYFISEADWEKHFEYWRKQMIDWIKGLGIDVKKIHEREVPESDRAHYSKKTVDFDYEFPFGTNELYGLAYRTDFDLKNHEKFSGQNLKYKNPETNEEFWPHVIEPTWGVDRSVLAVLVEHYAEDNDRVLLKLPPILAPYKAAVFPLLANKPELIKLARKIYDNLRPQFMTAWDDRGNIGKRYYSQDELGTPFCVTVDFNSLEDKKVTVRDRDTMKQERIAIKGLEDYLDDKLNV
ncbi:glycine--tRNA ligase [Candidatus Azambacteria bacterium RIFCSPHIGHO2_01_FULL_40_24]|uniref:Glycine--tRNA ligase n=1 Tax=Candidatus Azambacteria bacterium RIFCSPHIGHO2_01_FULL_40_24 TaxID=1797301 RepID=A0A1F5B2H3_9BACT|nr:MAG: glycine--tRNA ligase [Candidatus Azambacteria bacterium RIFCSPHIGHO2_01_FULL_40_24]